MSPQQYELTYALAWLRSLRRDRRSANSLPNNGIKRAPQGSMSDSVTKAIIRPMTAAEIRYQMRKNGREVPIKSVSAALSYLSGKGEVRKAGTRKPKPVDGHKGSYTPVIVWEKVDNGPH